MRATTRVGLAVRHIGVKGAVTQAWEGTFAEVIQELAKWLGPQYMATRFDLCLARSETEARRGLTLKGRDHEPIAAELNLDNLVALMNNPTHEAFAETTRCEHQIQNNMPAGPCSVCGDAQ